LRGNLALAIGLHSKGETNDEGKKKERNKRRALILSFVTAGKGIRGGGKGVKKRILPRMGTFRRGIDKLQARLVSLTKRGRTGREGRAWGELKHSKPRQNQSMSFVQKKRGRIGGGIERGVRSNLSKMDSQMETFPC